MNINITYHWDYLNYLTPNFKNGDWGPIARAEISLHGTFPTVDGAKELHGTYTYLHIPITGTKDPKQEIIDAINEFARKQNITIEMDCLNDKVNMWGEPF